MMPNTSSTHDYKRTAQILLAMYLPGILSLWLPAEKISIAGTTYYTSLWYQYSGMIAGAILIIMLLTQFIFLRKQQLLHWPAWVTGSYTAGFAVFKISKVAIAPAHKSLAATLPATISPAVALYVLLVGGIGLLVVQFWRLAKN